MLSITYIYPMLYIRNHSSKMINVYVNKDFSGSDDHKLYISLNFASFFLL